ncbi:hypothetical protein QFZ98_001884 [Paraburkholderia youngii]
MSSQVYEEVLLTRISFIGFGEAGGILGAALAAKGAQVSMFDLRGDALRDKASAAKIGVADTLWRAFFDSLPDPGQKQLSKLIDGNAQVAPMLTVRVTSTTDSRIASINARAAGDGVPAARIVRPISRRVLCSGTSSTTSCPD